MLFCITLVPPIGLVLPLCCSKSRLSGLRVCLFCVSCGLCRWVSLALAHPRLRMILCADAVLVLLAVLPRVSAALQRRALLGLHVLATGCSVLWLNGDAGDSGGGDGGSDIARPSPRPLLLRNLVCFAA